MSWQVTSLRSGGFATRKNDKEWLTAELTWCSEPNDYQRKTTYYALKNGPAEVDEKSGLLIMGFWCGCKWITIDNKLPADQLEVQLSFYGKGNYECQRHHRTMESYNAQSTLVHYETIKTEIDVVTMEWQVEHTRSDYVWPSHLTLPEELTAPIREKAKGEPTVAQAAYLLLSLGSPTSVAGRGVGGDNRSA